MSNPYAQSPEHDFLWEHLTKLPYFRALLRAVEARFYQSLQIAAPVLDLGSGDGDFAAQTFAKPLDVGLDPWLGPLRESQSRAAHKLLTLANGAHMPFSNCAFGTIVCNSVFEHIPDLEPVIAECFRVLRPGGRLLFCSPTDQFTEMLVGGRLFGDSYRRWFNRIARHAHCDSSEHWRARLEAHGFTLEQMWTYFSPRATRALEIGHYLGVPYWLSKKVSGRWVLLPDRRNPVLKVIEHSLRPIYNAEPSQQLGSGVFGVALKP